MGSVSGLGGSLGLNGSSGLRGYGGLASGLDRDTLIENMTYATRSKIARYKQKRQTVQWTQEAMRNITTKLYQLSDKYMSYSSSSNLISSKMFSRNQITAMGENSKYLSVSGSSTSADTISVLGVKNLAQQARISSKDSVSDQVMETAAISDSLGTTTDMNVVAGDVFYVKYGSRSYTVKMPTGRDYDYSNTAGLTTAMNEALRGVVIGSDGETLANVMEVKSDAAGKLSFVRNSNDHTGNILELEGDTGDLLKDLGFMGQDEEFDSLGTDRKTITTGSGLQAAEAAKPLKAVSLAEQLRGKQISFSYNGTIKWIKLDDYTTGDTLDRVKNDLQDKLNEAFGKNRIMVDKVAGDSAGEFKLTFQTTLPSGTTTVPDTSSVLSITAAEGGILGAEGESVFGIWGGESNRLNLSASIAKAGFAGADNLSTSGPLTIKNGEGVEVNLSLPENGGLSWDSSVEEIINAINKNKELGIKVSYQSNSDRFVVESTEQGASGEINLSGSVVNALFGGANHDDAGVLASNHKQEGKDAVISVKYAGTDEVVEISRGSNSISIDGLNITVKGAFGYDGDVLKAGTEAVTFDAQVDADATTKTVKEMIDAFNEVLTLVNSEVGQKPNRDYSPLTDEQAEAMSEKQIEKWETEAKKGLLFNDADLRSLADKLRFIIPADKRAEFEEMGITVSTNYSDNGKLVFDEEKFKAALATDPEAVREAFTSKAEEREDGTRSEGGLMVKMKNIMDVYASMTGSTKGILVERAGSVYAPTTILKNSMQNQIDDIDDNIDQLVDKLQIEQNRYIAQFTALESLISQMNSQSGYLSSMFGQ